MTIFAIFFCMAVTGSCRPVDPPHYSLGYFMQGTVYRSLKDCQKAIERQYVSGPMDSQGRVFVGQGMWYECLSRHVGTWQHP